MKNPKLLFSAFMFASLLTASGYSVPDPHWSNPHTTHNPSRTPPSAPLKGQAAPVDHLYLQQDKPGAPAPSPTTFDRVYTPDNQRGFSAP